jgi:hypothetical protein
MSYIVVASKFIQAYTDPKVSSPYLRRSYGFHDLTDLVNDKIREGYMPKGGVSTFMHSDGYPIYLQAMYNPVPAVPAPPAVPAAAAVAADPVIPRGGTRRSKKARRA